MSKDTIYREDAIKALGNEPMVWMFEDEYTKGQRSQWRADVTAIEFIPSADRPQGEWIADENGGCRCSVCGVQEERFVYGLGEYWHGRGESNFCPNCGADMREREGE